MILSATCYTCDRPIDSGPRLLDQDAILLIDTIIFDFDGVIIDTETPDYATWQEVFHQHGANLDMAIWGKLIGGRFRFDVHGHLEKLIGYEVDRDSLLNERRERYLEMIAGNPVLPGVEDYINEARRLGLKLGVASSSNSNWVTGHLRQRNLIHHFESIKTADDVALAKPDPDVYLASVEHLGSKPENTLAIEDSANGVTAAKRAGLFCVVVPNKMTVNLDTSHADMRLDSLADMQLSTLLEVAGKRLADG